MIGWRSWYIWVLILVLLVCGMPRCLRSVLQGFRTGVALHALAEPAKCRRWSLLPAVYNMSVVWIDTSCTHVNGVNLVAFLDFKA